MVARTANVRGTGIVESVIAMALVGIVLAAMIGAAIHQQRFYLVVNDAAAAESNLERLETVLTRDLLPLNGEAKDILHASSDSISLRTYRGVYSLCAKFATVPVHVIVRGLTEDLAPKPDSAIVYSSGTQASLSDDHWKRVDVSRVTKAVCPDGSRGWDLEVGGLAGVLNQVPVGAPLRLFDYGSYWLTTENGSWHVKTDAFQGTATLVSGPLAPADSSAGTVVTFRYVDAAGSPTTNLDEIAYIELDANALGVVPNRRSGEPLHKDRTISIRLRNSDN